MASIIPTPLTTIFSLPYTLSTSCFSQMYWDGSVAVVLGPGSQCIPAGPAPVSSTLSTYYSPGLWDGRPACPDNWTPACSETITLGTTTETAVTCCPNANGLGPLSYVSFTCQPTASLSVAIQFNKYGCTMQLGALAADVPLTVTNTYSSTPVVTLLTVKPYQGPNAYSVQVRWQETDLHPVVSRTSSSTAASSSTPAPASHASDVGGLSSGAKIAVGVAVSILVIATAIIGMFSYRRKRKARRAHQSVQNTHQSDTYSRHYLDIPPSELETNTDILGYSGRAEMPAFDREP